MSKSILKAIFFLFFNQTLLFALNDSFTDKARGQSAFPILKSPVSPFFYSLGGGGSAVLTEHNVFLNPAAAYSLNSNSFSFSFHKDGVEATRSDAFFMRRYGRRVNAISVSYIDYGDFLKVDENANELGFFSPYDLVVCYSYGFGSVRERFGIRLKYISSNMIYEKSSAVAIDSGFIVNGNKTTLSLLVRNIGPSPKIGNRHYALPLEFSAGFNYRYLPNLRGIFDLKFPSDNKAYTTAALDWRIPAMGCDFYVRVGASTLNLREIGWSGIFSGGFGFEYYGFGVDYSFTPVSNIDSIHRFLVRYSFGKVESKKEEEYRFREFVAKEISLKKKIAVFPFVSDNSTYSSIIANSIEERLMEKKHSVISRLDPCYISNSKTVYNSELEVVEAAQNMGADYAVWGVITKKDEVKSQFTLILISLKDKKKYSYSLVSNIYDVRNVALKLSDEISSILSQK
ncbi:MAG: hypothetical protein ACP5IO_00085 [Elusimicrobiales bacterium]